MYRLSHFLLTFSLFWLACCLALIVALGWPLTGIILGLVAFKLVRDGKNRRGKLTTLGSARWAGLDDLYPAGMIRANSGLLLGRLIAERGNHRAGKVRKLFDARLRAEEKCKSFWFWNPDSDSPLVRLPNAVHSVTIAPSGTGKGTSGVVPFLLSCQDSCVVVDFKGENARLTAEHRRKHFGHRVVLLDPYKLVTQTPDTFNPLDFIDANDPKALDECGSLSDSLVVRSPEEREPHWSDSAVIYIKALLGVVVRFGDPKEGTRSLQTLRDIVSNPQRLELAIKLMVESDAWGGMLARCGGQLLHYVDKEKSSTLTTVSRHLRFLDTLTIAESTRESSFDPSDLLKGKMTIYLILPFEHARSMAGLERTWIGSMLRAIIRGGSQEETKVHFVLDEAASLGHMEAIDDAVNMSRGFGVRLQFYYQSLGQLKQCFPNGEEQTLLSNCTQVFFGVNDMGTAEYVSSRLGEQTIVVDSGGTNRGTSHQSSRGMHASNSSGRSDGSSESWQQQARKLLKPEEVIALSPREAITFTAGVPPIRTRLLRYYDDPMFAGQHAGRLSRALTATYVLVASALLFLFSMAFALALAATVESQSSRHPLPPPRPVVSQQLDGQ